MWWFLLFIASALALRDLEPEPPVASTRSDDWVEEGWLNVRLDHFQAADTNTFRMRYFYNSRFASPNDTDMVIFVGGEWAISPGWVRAGLPYELAEQLSAGLFYTEHRYYGQTWPTENGKVALVGCSYAGTMATWMRLGYPHLVDAVFSDSGPLHAQEDFPEYLKVITEALRVQGSEECVSSIAEAIEGIVAMLALPTGATQISNMFNTCTQIQANVPLDVATFFWYGITETFAYLVQYAAPGDIEAACEVINGASVLNPVQRLANWVTAQPWTQPCIETRYTAVVDSHRNTSYQSPDATMRLWTYQTCVEYGWYQSTSGHGHPFLATVPLEYFHQMCRDFFTADINEDRLRAGISRTNHLFAGLTFLPDHVVSVAGGHDPWSPVGPDATHATARAPVIVVPRESHCRAIGSTTGNDTALEAAKRAVLAHMTSFLGRPPPPVGSAARLAPALLLVVAGLLAL